MANYANIAATNMEALCNDERFGYSQGSRWGDASLGSIYVECEGHTSEFYIGDRDCSSAVIDCWQEALKGSPYEGLLDGATYTGNMRSVFVDSGLFEWHDMSFSASRGDVYLNEVNHTAMCLDGSPSNDILGEFCISENGTIYGQTGDQTAYESYIHWYYDYPWDGILHYIGPTEESDGSDDSSGEEEEVSQPYYKTYDTEWRDKVIGTSCTATDDDYAGIYGNDIYYISIGNVSQYRVGVESGEEPDWVYEYNPDDFVSGAAGVGDSPITKLWIPDSDVHYQVHTRTTGEWLPEMIGSYDTDGSSDDYAGNGEPIDAIRIWR